MLTVAVVGLALLLGAGWAVAKSTGLIGQRVSTPAPSTRASAHFSQRIPHPQKLAIGKRRYVPILVRPSHNKGEHELPVRVQEPTVQEPPVQPPTVQEPPVQPPLPPADTTAPQTLIDSGPVAETTDTTASFAFSASEPDSTFSCKLDAADWSSCSSPVSFTALTVGEHTFSVRATDAAGNVDQTPASQSWTVQAPPPPPPPPDTTAPETTITAQPASPTTATSASFSFASSEPGSSFACKLDSSSWAPCSSPQTYGTVALGEHEFSVRATDAAGNTDSSPATSAWTVQAPPPPPPPADTTPPDTSIASGPSGNTTATSASFSFSSSEAGSSFACKLDGGNWAACVSPQTYSGVTVGEHTFSVRATDAAGNVDPTPASQTWTVQAPPPPTGCSSTVSSLTAAQTALASASPGQTVCLADGTYGSLSLTGSKASPGVTLQAVNPGSVTVGSVSASGSGYTVSHLISGSATCGQGAKNIVFDHMKIGGEASAYGSSSSAAGPCTWQYSEIGPQVGSGEKDSDRCWVNCVGLTWKDNLIHVANEDGSHNDGFQGYGNVHGLVFTGNRFVGGLGSQAFFLKDGTDTNITFSDNLIVNRGNNANGNTANPFQVYELKPSPNDPFYTGYGLYMTHNTIWGNGNTSYLRDCDGLNYFIQRNVIDGLSATQERDPSSCISPWISANVSDEQDYNVLSSNGNIRAHGAHDTSAQPVFVSPTSQDSTGDWQLAPGSPGYFGGLPERAGITWDPTTRHYGP